MKHFPLRQNMILTTSFFFARDSTYYGNVQITNYLITLFLFVLKYKLNCYQKLAFKM
jgi:hypothetical protein